MKYSFILLACVLLIVLVSSKFSHKQTVLNQCRANCVNGVSCPDCTGDGTDLTNKKNWCCKLAFMKYCCEK